MKYNEMKNISQMLYLVIIIRRNVFGVIWVNNDKLFQKFVQFYV